MPLGTNLRNQFSKGADLKVPISLIINNHYLFLFAFLWLFLKLTMDKNPAERSFKNNFAENSQFLDI